ncbi:MAG: adenylyl-sulfate kinase [Chitinophagaceae bacterium]|nr:MAG: adenylyl-sulfate kinase [Chitinophagaceae bacterium]
MLILQLTGLSGAGKTTLANALSEQLLLLGHAVTIVDGDVYRNSLNKDLGFSEADRRENIRRLQHVAIEKSKEGDIVLLAAINPFEDQRNGFFQSSGALVVYLFCPMPVLMLRDTKGLYKRAILPDADPQKIHNLTGVNDRYDEPQSPHFTGNTAIETIQELTARLLEFVIQQINAV